MSDRLIVAVGNPGLEYSQTKHNIAWLLLDHYESTKNCIWKNKFKGEYTSCEFDSGKVHFLRPQTYMNLSGESVAPYANFFKIVPENILVIHDELDLNFGVLAFKKFGGLAGHNGLKSISKSLGTQNFMRLRMGIDRPVHGSVSDWVLSKFSGENADFLDHYLEESTKALDLYINSGMDIALKKYNKKKVIS